jgi:hypothetical protein
MSKKIALKKASVPDSKFDRVQLKNGTEIEKSIRMIRISLRRLLRHIYQKMRTITKSLRNMWSLK